MQDRNQGIGEKNRWAFIKPNVYSTIRLKYVVRILLPITLLVGIKQTKNQKLLNFYFHLDRQQAQKNITGETLEISTLSDDFWKKHTLSGQ